METALYVGLSRQMALRRQMDVIANNLANMNTTSYRSEAMMFQEYLNKDPSKTGGEGTISYVVDYGLSRNFGQGELRPTTNPLDIAISGSGYFTVRQEDNSIAYTRNGQLHIDDDGVLVNVTNRPVLSEDDSPIEVEVSGGVLNIAGDGTVSNEQGILGKIKLVSFDNEYELKNAGGGLYTTDADPKAALGTEIVQRMLENSNVNAIVQMTRMIDVSRSYQSTTNLINKTEESEVTAIRRLGKVA